MMHSANPLRTRLALTAALFLSVALGGCDALDRLLDVETPSRVVEADLDDPVRASLLVESVQNEFRCAFAHYVNLSGTIGWEWSTTTDGATARSFLEARQFTPSGFGAGAYATGECGSATAHYMTLSRARWFADDVLERLDGWEGALGAEKTEWEAEVAAWSGYSYVFFGESMCSVAFDGGPEQTPEDAFELALSKFDRAVAAAQASGRQDFVNLARVGKGRTLLNLGRTSEAASAVADVPEGFSFELDYSSVASVTNNRQFRDNHQDEALTVGERYRNMEFRGVSDPRVPVENQGFDPTGFGVTLWTQHKYESLGDPVRLASWEEAALIRAEAAVEEGRLQDAVALINALHANVGLPELESNDPDEIMDVLIYNRRAELFLESHHLMDLKRYDLGLHPEPGTPFYTGGMSYAERTCLPLPDVERNNNPNIPS